MSSTPPESETYQITFSKDEQWVIHHVLSTRIDDAIDDGESPPAWTLELFETIESDENTVTGYQARRLYDALSEYLDRDEVPQRDIAHGSSCMTRLETILEEAE